MNESTKVDAVKLRQAIRRDSQLAQEQAIKLIQMAQGLIACEVRNIDKLDSGRSIGDLGLGGSADLGMQASRLARRLDHMSALIEVAYLAEQGDL